MAVGNARWRANSGGSRLLRWIFFDGREDFFEISFVVYGLRSRRTMVAMIDELATYVDLQRRFGRSFPRAD